MLLTLHPPPTCKIKVETLDEHEALVLFCDLCAYGAMDTFDLFARHLRFAILAKEVKGKQKYSLSLTAHEAILFCNMRGVLANKLGNKLSPYNAALYQRWANDILNIIQPYYATKINA